MTEQPQPPVYPYPVPDPVNAPVVGFTAQEVMTLLDLLSYAAQRPYTPTDPAPPCACGPDSPGCAAARQEETPR